MAEEQRVKSVAIIGAGAAGAATAAAFEAEKYFDVIKVFERREKPGGTWIYDALPPSQLPLRPGGLPTEVDPPLPIPEGLPKHMPPSPQERWVQTPIYNSLTTNVPHIAMSFSDTTFPYGPFVPHHIPRQYIESYFSAHGVDTVLNLNTTVEDLCWVSRTKLGGEKWKLTLRKYDQIRNVDFWWTENFDAVVLANGHYAVPYIPEVRGLAQYIELFPERVKHSKTYRSPSLYHNERVLTIGNSASGHDVTAELVQTAKLPVYQSRRSKSRWDGDKPAPGITWKPVIKEFLSNGRILFEDDTHLDNIDTVIYCTGYKASFPFWNSRNNGRELWDYEANKLRKIYWHTFFHDFKTLGIVGMPRVLTFRSFEYQAIALARLFSGRNAKELPALEVQQKWEDERTARRIKEGKNFHDIEWESGETMEWLAGLYEIAGLPRLSGEGRVPPVLGGDVRWAVEHLRKYPEPGKDERRTPEFIEKGGRGEEVRDEEYVLVERAGSKDMLAFI